MSNSDYDSGSTALNIKSTAVAFRSRLPTAKSVSIFWFNFY